MAGPPKVEPKKEVAVTKKPKELSPQELAEEGYKAARQTLGLEKPDKAHPQVTSTKRYAKAIGFMGWGLKQLASATGKSPFQYLNGLVAASVLDPQVNAYLATFLQIGALTGLRTKSGERLTVLSQIIKHLPPQIKKLPPAEQAKFVAMVLAIIHRESKFDSNCVSYTGTAFGLMQIQVLTAAQIIKGGPLSPKEIKQALAKKGKYQKMLMNPETNLRIGMRYLYKLLTAPGGDWSSVTSRTYAFIAYCKGEGGAKGVKTTDYQQDVELRYQLYIKLHFDQIKKEVLGSSLVTDLLPHEQVIERPRITPSKR